MFFNSDQLVVMCTCGCNTGFVFKYLDGAIYIDTIDAYFYSEQNKFNLKHHLKQKFRLIFKKERWITGACVERKDVEEIISYLESHECNDEECVNHSRLVLNDVMPDDSIDEIDAEDELYELMLYSTLSKKEVLFGKEFLAGEICLNEEGRIILLNGLKSVLEINKENRKNLKKRLECTPKEELEKERETRRKKADKEYKLRRAGEKAVDILWLAGKCIVISFAITTFVRGLLSGRRKKNNPNLSVKRRRVKCTKKQTHQQDRKSNFFYCLQQKAS